MDTGHGPPQAPPQDPLTTAAIPSRDLGALPASDLLFAGYSLPYIPPLDSARIWGLIRASLRPAAWFAGNLFGVRDSWAGNPEATFLGEEAARALFEGMEILMFNEVEEDGQADGASKHWHVLDIIARRRPAPSRPTRAPPWAQGVPGAVDPVPPRLSRPREAAARLLLPPDALLRLTLMHLRVSTLSSDASPSAQSAAGRATLTSGAPASASRDLQIGVATAC